LVEEFLVRIIHMEQLKFLIEMNYFNLPGKVKYFLIFMIATPFVGLFGWVFLNALTDTRSSGEIYLSFQVKKECFGKVKSIYREKMNHNVLTLSTMNCIFQVPYKWESNFKINDSISKKEGELFVEHYRGGKLLEVLDYHDIAKDMK